MLTIIPIKETISKGELKKAYVSTVRKKSLSEEAGQSKIHKLTGLYIE